MGFKEKAVRQALAAASDKLEAALERLEVSSSRRSSLFVCSSEVLCCCDQPLGLSVCMGLGSMRRSICAADSPAKG
jgi:hypothetical protein